MNAEIKMSDQDYQHIITFINNFKIKEIFEKEYFMLKNLKNYNTKDVTCVIEIMNILKNCIYIKLHNDGHETSVMPDKLFRNLNHKVFDAKKEEWIKKALDYIREERCYIYSSLIIIK